MKMIDQVSVLTLVLVCAVIGIFVVVSVSSKKDMPVQVKEINENKEVVLYQDLRKLWAEHVIWTREYINSSIEGTPGTEEAAERLMKNQEDLGAALVPYYGAEAGSKLTALLQEHIEIAVELIAVAKNNDLEVYKEVRARWETNGQDIAAFLTATNSNWSEVAVQEAMAMHLKTTNDEVITRLNKQYAQNVAAFDAAFDHILTMSDILSAGIIRQFPERFQ